MRKLALHWKIIIGMVLGVILGIILSYISKSSVSEEGDIVTCKIHQLDLDRKIIEEKSFIKDIVINSISEKDIKEQFIGVAEGDILTVNVTKLFVKTAGLTQDLSGSKYFQFNVKEITRSGPINFTNNWIVPWGQLFINLLKLIAVPLILASLIKGVSSLADTSKLSRMGGKTIAIYLMSTVISVTIGLLLVNTIEPGVGFDRESIELSEDQERNRDKKINDAKKVNDSGPLQPLVDIVPDNIFFAASYNRNMLQVIFFAILFGLAMVILPSEKTKYVKGFFDGINDIILMIVDIIMKGAPYGVFALLAGLVVKFGGKSDMFFSLGWYCLTVLVGLLIMIFIIYPFILMVFTKLKYRKFFQSIMPAQMLAFSTSSSAATLPVTMERCENHLGVSKEVSSFVLPLGATINMDGTSLYQSVAAVFIAQAFGISLDLTDQLTIVLTATLASIGAAAVPGAGMIMLIIVLESTPSIPSNIIAPGLALIFGVDRILDMCRTVVNVTGDATVSTVVASSEGKLREVSHNIKD